MWLSGCIFLCFFVRFAVIVIVRKTDDDDDGGRALNLKVTSLTVKRYTVKQKF
jgi:hypothetical protein